MNPEFRPLNLPKPFRLNATKKTKKALISVLIGILEEINHFKMKLSILLLKIVSSKVNYLLAVRNNFFENLTFGRFFVNCKFSWSPEAELELKTFGFLEIGFMNSHLPPDPKVSRFSRKFANLLSTVSFTVSSSVSSTISSLSERPCALVALTE